MTLNIRNPEAAELARELARIDDTSITDAVIVALRETIRNRLRRETPSETARKILARHGLKVQPGHKPAAPEVFHDLDHDLTGTAASLLTLDQLLRDTDVETLPV